MTTTLIIRDDDTSFFTAPDLLHRVYGRLFDAGIPICLAVIPAHNGSVRVEHRPGQPFDPSIPPQYRGRDHDHAITDNPAICAFLAEISRQNLVEVCQHGLNHEYMEFGSDDTPHLEAKLRQGRAILAEALPDVSIRTFIAPYDRLSVAAFTSVLDSGYNLATRAESVPFPDPVADYAHVIHPSGRHIFTSEEYIFTHRDEPSSVLATARKRLAEQDFLILTNHYWTFFHDWSGPHPLLDAWDQLVDDLLASRANIKFSTFQQEAGSSE